VQCLLVRWLVCCMCGNTCNTCTSFVKMSNKFACLSEMHKLRLCNAVILELQLLKSC